MFTEMCEAWQIVWIRQMSDLHTQTRGGYIVQHLVSNMAMLDFGCQCLPLSDFASEMSMAVRPFRSVISLHGGVISAPTIRRHD